MNSSYRAARLRCALCRRGLLAAYDVYSLTTGNGGAVNVPVWRTSVKGYFYAKGSRHSAEVTEIAGEIAGGTVSNYRLVVFENEGGVNDLVDVDGVVYRVTGVRSVHALCRVMELEVYPCEFSR